MKDFEKYLDSLRAESDRGAVPNNNIPISKLITVADTIIGKIAEINPIAGMYF